MMWVHRVPVVCLLSISDGETKAPDGADSCLKSRGCTWIQTRVCMSPWPGPSACRCKQSMFLGAFSEGPLRVLPHWGRGEVLPLDSTPMLTHSTSCVLPTRCWVSRCLSHLYEASAMGPPGLWGKEVSEYFSVSSTYYVSHVEGAGGEFACRCRVLTMCPVF